VGSAGSVNGRGGLAWAILPVVAAVAVHAASTGNDFVLDDVRLIPDNPLVCGTALDVPAVFHSTYWAGSGLSDASAYRPVTILTHAVLCRVAGPEPFWPRAVNVALHALCAALVFLLARRVLGAASPGTSRAAAACGVLFAVHPLLSEPVLLVTGRSDLLAAAATLALAWLAARLADLGDEPRRTGRLAGLAAATFCLQALGIFSKEGAIAAPALMALAFAVRRPPSRAHAGAWKRFAAVALAPAAVACLVYVAARQAVLGTLYAPAMYSFLDNPLAGASLATRAATGVAVLGRYLALFLAPVGLSVDYSYAAVPPVSSVADPWLLAGAASCLGLAAAVVATVRRLPHVAFGVAWAAVAIVPVSNIPYAIGTVMAERLCYLPAAGLLVATVALARLAAARLGGPARLAAGAGALAVTAVLAVLSVARGADLATNCGLFARTVETSPASAKAWYGHGICLLESEATLGAAIEAFDRSLRIWPEYGSAAVQLGQALERAGHDAEGLARLGDFVGRRPGHVEAAVAYSMMLGRQGRPGEAETVLSDVLRRRPGDPGAIEALRRLRTR
jgi:tetratricopeptide (TPR) repeat protein